MLGFLWGLLFGGKTHQRRTRRNVRAVRVGWKAGRALGGRW
jgi:hypothetical protein